MNTKKCPNCRTPLDDQAPEGLCPACLMKAGLETRAADVLTKPTTASADNPAKPNEGIGASLDIAEVRRRFPQLEVIEQIGRGGMGVVFKARQPQLDRLVALKILPAELARTPGFAERFAREARALARLNHPNIVSVFDFGEREGWFYFIMEFVDGANLGQLIAARQVTPETALALVPKICEALQFAHDEGILHRDIKPANILVDKKGRVKIADFGLAKLIGAKEEVDHSLTVTGVTMGTPRYMAPEQFENTKTVDHRADIYSLGVVFYEMLTGEVPMGRFMPPSKKVQVDVRIDEVVLHSLEKEPEQRYQHVSEIKTDVENITQHGARAPLPVPPAPAAAPPPVQPGGFWTTPQPPEWVNAVAKPMLIVSGIFAVVLLMSLFVGQESPLEHLANVMFYAWLPVMTLTWMITTIRYVNRRNKALTDGGRASVRAEDAQRPDADMFTKAKASLKNASVGMLVAGCLVLSWAVLGCIIDAWPMITGKGGNPAVAMRVVLTMLFYLYAGILMMISSGTMKHLRGRSFNIGVCWMAMLLPISLIFLRMDDFNRMVWGVGFGALFGFQAYRALRKPDIIAAFEAAKPKLPMIGKDGDANFQSFEKPKSGLGLLSLWLAITGMVLPIVIVVVIVASGKAESLLPVFLCGLLGAVMELAALVCGIIARKSASGKAGLIIACIGLLLASQAFMALSTTGHKSGGGTVGETFSEAVSAAGAMMSSQAVITEEPAAGDDSPYYSLNLYRPFRYHVNAPANHRVTFWTEFWRDGVLDQEMTGGLWDQQMRGQVFDGSFEFSLADGVKLSPDLDGKIRWNMTVVNPLGIVSGTAKERMKYQRDTVGNWSANPFARYQPTRLSAGKWSVAPGEVATLLTLCGGKLSQTATGGADDNIAQQYKACMMLKARFDPVPALELKDKGYGEAFGAADVQKFQPREKPSASTTPVESEDRFEVRYDKTQIPSVSAPGRQDYAFAFTAPTGQVLSVWMESWQDGKCEIGRLDETITAKTNEPINGVLHFSLADGATMSAESAGKKRYDWTIELTKTTETPVKGTETVKWDCGEWRKDILNWPGAMFVGGLDNDVYNNSCHPKSGETVTLLWVDTYDPGVGSVGVNRHSSLCQVPLLQGKPKAAIALRARFSPAAPGELKSGYCDAGLHVRAAAALVTPAQFAIATEIGSDLRLCKTPAEATGKLVATAGTSEGRKRAEQMLRELGGTVTTNAVPEELIKALDNAVSKLQTKSLAASAQKPDVTATDVLRQTVEKYAALSYFSASGQVTYESTLTNGGKAIQRQSTFSINLARPEFYRVIWTNADSPAVTRLGAVWSAGDGHRALVAGKVGTLLNREQAMAAAAYPSGGLRNVPGLFFKDGATNFLQSLKNPILLPEQTVGADVCYVVTADRADGRTTLWITKKDSLLKKIQTSGGVVPPRETMVASNENTDETLRKLLKTMGQDSTPGAINKMKKQITEGLKRGVSSPYTFTTIFETIKVNELLIKEDFEFTAPDLPRRDI